MILEQRFFLHQEIYLHITAKQMWKRNLIYLFFSSSKVFEVGVTVPTPSPQTVYNNSKSSKPLPNQIYYEAYCQATQRQWEQVPIRHSTNISWRGRNEGDTVAVLKELPVQWGGTDTWLGTRQHAGTTADYMLGVGRLTLTEDLEKTSAKKWYLTSSWKMS